MADLKNMQLDIVKKEDASGTDWSHRAVRFLNGVIRKLDGSNRYPVFPNVSSSDADFVDAITRASKIQELGYDIGFKFVSHYPDSPFMHICVGRYKKKVQVSIGFDFFSQHMSLVKTLSEIMERALWDDNGVYWKTNSVRSNAKSLGDKAMNIGIRTLAGFSEEQRKGSTRLSYDDTTMFLWTPATRLHDGSSCLVPSQLVSGRWAGEMDYSEPLLRAPNSNGLATHRSLEMAQYRGAQELIERDAFMIMYHNQLMPARIDPSSIRDLQTRSILKKFESYRLSCELFLMPTDMPVCAVLCVIRDESGEGPALAFGARSDHDPERAVLSALSECYGVWHIARQMELYKKPISERPWNSFERIAFWGKQENTSKISWLFGGPVVALTSGKGNAETARELGRAARKRGCDLAFVKMSSPALERLGLYSVCVVSPELQPLYLDSDPEYLGGVRLAGVPKALGLRAKKSPPIYPHPFP